MSKRRQAGDIVMKRAGAGFLGVPARIRLEPEENPAPCVLSSWEPGDGGCEDPECLEWANCAILDDNDQVVSYCYHVSECEMEDIGGIQEPSNSSNAVV